MASPTVSNPTKISLGTNRVGLTTSDCSWTKGEVASSRDHFIIFSVCLSVNSSDMISSLAIWSIEGPTRQQDKYLIISTVPLNY